jgi:hypothetical protein
MVRCTTNFRSLEYCLGNIKQYLQRAKKKIDNYLTTISSEANRTDDSNNIDTKDVSNNSFKDEIGQVIKSLRPISIDKKGNGDSKSEKTEKKEDVEQLTIQSLTSSIVNDFTSTTTSASPLLRFTGSTRLTGSALALPTFTEPIL